MNKLDELKDLAPDTPTPPKRSPEEILKDVEKSMVHLDRCVKILADLRTKKSQK